MPPRSARDLMQTFPRNGTTRYLTGRAAMNQKSSPSKTFLSIFEHNFSISAKVSK